MNYIKIKTIIMKIIKPIYNKKRQPDTTQFPIPLWRTVFPRLQSLFFGIGMSFTLPCATTWPGSFRRNSSTALMR